MHQVSSTAIVPVDEAVRGRHDSVVVDRNLIHRENTSRRFDRAIQRLIFTQEVNCLFRSIDPAERVLERGRSMRRESERV